MKTIWQQGLQAAEIKDGAIIHTPTGAEFTRYGEMILRVLHAFHLVLWMVILLAGFSLMAPPNAGHKTQAKALFAMVRAPDEHGLTDGSWAIHCQDHHP